MAIRRVAVLLLVLAMVIQSGCVSVPKVPSTKYQPGMGEVAVVPTIFQPEINFEGFVHNKGEGALVGAGGTFLVCMGMMGQGSCTGFICGPALVLWLGVCTASSVVGGTVGAVEAPSGEARRSAEQTMISALDAKTIQNSLRLQVELAAQGRDRVLIPLAPEVINAVQQQKDYRSLAAEGVDTVLEVTLTKVGTNNGGINPPLRFYMEAAVRLVSTADNRELMTESYRYSGPAMKLAEWAANDAAELLKAIETGYRVLGAQIFENTFMLYPFPDRDPHSAGFMGVAFGLAPLYPTTRGALTGDKIIGSHFEWTTVNGLRPTLRWQPFPRDVDVAKQPQEMGRISNVRYDLVVAEEFNMAPGPLVYRREGLPDTSHTLKVTLKKGTRYFWTVRARFELDGRERLTEWSSTHYIARQGMTAPSVYSFRFKTP